MRGPGRGGDGGGGLARRVCSSSEPSPVTTRSRLDRAREPGQVEHRPRRRIAGWRPTARWRRSRRRRRRRHQVCPQIRAGRPADDRSAQPAWPRQQATSSGPAPFCGPYVSGSPVGPVSGLSTSQAISTVASARAGCSPMVSSRAAASAPSPPGPTSWPAAVRHPGPQGLEHPDPAVGRRTAANAEQRGGVQPASRAAASPRRRPGSSRSGGDASSGEPSQPGHGRISMTASIPPPAYEARRPDDAESAPPARRAPGETGRLDTRRAAVAPVGDRHDDDLDVRADASGVRRPGAARPRPR